MQSGQRAPPLGQTHTLTHTHMRYKDGRAQLAGDAGTPPLPSTPPCAAFGYVCMCMFGRSLASFLYAIEHTLMLYDVVMLVKMLVHTHVCVCDVLPHATSHCLADCVCVCVCT